MKDYFGNLSIVLWVFLALGLAVLLLGVGLVHYSIKLVNAKFNTNLKLDRISIPSFKFAK